MFDNDAESLAPSSTIEVDYEVLMCLFRIIDTMSRRFLQDLSL